MGRCCFGKIAFLLLALVAINPAYARCPMADKYHQEGKLEEELDSLTMCAISYNDDDSQVKMAEGYINGSYGFKKNEKMALYMYQLSAENGNADSQVKLAE